jgi:hypothetical protein
MHRFQQKRAKGGKGKGKGNSTDNRPRVPLALHDLQREGDLEKMSEGGVAPMTTVNLQLFDHLKRVPLHLAAHYGHHKVVEKMIEIFPAAIHREALDSYLPAHFAAQAGNVTRIQHHDINFVNSVIISFCVTLPRG